MPLCRKIIGIRLVICTDFWINMYTTPIYKYKSGLDQLVK